MFSPQKKFSIMESVLSTVIDLFHEKLNTNRKKYILRIVFCGTLFVLGLVMVARVREEINSIYL